MGIFDRTPSLLELLNENKLLKDQRDMFSNLYLTTQQELYRVKAQPPLNVDSLILEAVKKRVVLENNRYPLSGDHRKFAAELADIISPPPLVTIKYAGKEYQAHEYGITADGLEINAKAFRRYI